MTAAIAIMASLSGGIALLLLRFAARPDQAAESPADKVNALLPQTQCAQCGYPGCRPYAEAIIDGTADINQCAPGGDATVAALARLLGRDTTTVNPAFGEHTSPALAVIDEERCIGCALCLDACPVDAIVGAPKFTHTVIADECTGCELCLPPCPVDCIDLTQLRVRRA